MHIYVGFEYSDDEDSDQDDDQDGISLLTIYKSLDINSALNDKSNYINAVDELYHFVLKSYSDDKFSKIVRRLIEQDIETAIAVFDGGQLAAKALHELISVAVAVSLPKAKKESLKRLYKHKCINLKRKRKASHPQHENNNNDDDDIHIYSFLDLPGDCIYQILSQLDPYSLARISATCHYLYARIHTHHHREQPGSEIDLWETLFNQTFGKRCMSSQRIDICIAEAKESILKYNEQRTKGSRAFTAAARLLPEWLLPWRSSRILINKEMEWILPSMRQAIMSENKSCDYTYGIARTPFMKGFFLTPEQVVLRFDSSRLNFDERMVGYWKHIVSSYNRL